MATNPTYKTSNNTLNYYFDFSPFDDGYYQMSFTFVSGENALDPCVPANIHINFGTTNVYSSIYYQTQANASQHVGLLYPSMSSTITGHGFYHAGITDNSPIVIRRPNSNNFTVSVFNWAGTPFIDTVGSNLADYLMVLDFKKIKDV